MIRVIRRGVAAMAMGLVLTLNLSAALAAPKAVTAVLDQASAETEIIILIPNLSVFADKLKLLSTSFGINNPDMQDPLASFKRESGLSAGLQDDGAVAVLISGVQLEGGAPPVVQMLLPVSDYKALVSAVGGDPAQAVTQVKLGSGPPAFVRQVGSFAVFSDKSENIANFKPAGAGAAMAAAAGKLGNHYLDTTDVAVLLNMPVFAPKLREQAKKGFAEALAQIDNNPNQPAGEVMIAKSIINLYSTGIDSVLRDATSLVFNLDVKPAGIGLTYSTQFKPDSELGKMFTTGAGGAPKLDMLPNSPYLFATSMNFQGVAFVPIIEKAMAAIPAEQGGPILKMMRDSMTLTRQLKAGATAYYAPSPGAPIGPGSLMSGVNVFQADDANAYAKTYKDYVTSLNGTKLDIPAPNAANADPNAPAPAVESISFVSSVTPNVLKIDGVDVDQYQFIYNFPPAMMQQMGPAAPLMMAMGMTGQSGYLAPVNGHVIVTTSLDAQLINKSVAAVRAKPGSGLGSDKDINTVRAELPPDASMEMFVNVGELIKMGKNIAAMMGAAQPAAADAPALPPVGMGIGVNTSGVAGRLFLPMPVITTAVNELGPVIQMMMMGGMQGGHDDFSEEQGEEAPPPSF